MARIGFGVLLLIGFGLCPRFFSPACAQVIDEQDLAGPLLDGDPFDLLRLNKEGDNALLKIAPLSEPPPRPLPDRGTLIFEYADDSGEMLQVPFSSIESYSSFNELLLKEAERWTRKKENAKAFRNLLYVYDHGGKDNPQLVKELRKSLFLDGKTSFEKGDFELALSIFEDLYRENPDLQFPGINKKLIEIVFACYDGIIQKQFDAEDYLKVKNTLGAAKSKYDETEKESVQHLVDRWKSIFDQKADELMQRARQLADQGKGREAHLASRQAEQMAPGRADIKKLQEVLLKKFPLIIVGVSQAGSQEDPTRIEHFGDRRVGRLTTRTIVELRGLSDEGGVYRFLNGKLIRADERGLKYILEIDPTTGDFGTPPADAFQIGARLLAAADERSENYNLQWAKVLDKISIDDGNKVIITLRTPYVRPDALIAMTYSRNPTSREAIRNGIYIATQTDDDFTTFELNPLYSPDPDDQHPVIIEQLYSDASDAVDDLVKGNIDVVDRIPIADIDKLKATPGIVVRPYLLPTVHLLVPKIRGELKNDPNFRSGLSFAIDREKIVRQVICDGKEVNGCEPISGPFPIGTEDSDQIAYGYNMRVRPLGFNTTLAMVLIEIACKPNKKRKTRLKNPSLVIVHPDSFLARKGAQAIARAWSDVGVPTSTKQLPPGESVPTDDQWDFLYLEVTMEEPLVDINKILGPDGIVRNASAPVEQTMRKLSTSETWRKTCSNMRRLHRQIAVDLSVIPLWQIREYYAYRNTVRGIGRDLIHLYQNVDRWRIDVYGSDEEE